MGIAFGIGIALRGPGRLAALGSVLVHAGLWPGASLKSFCIVVLGGLDSIVGVASGSLALALAEAFGVRYMPASLQNLISFVVLLVVLIALPKGIAGTVQALRRG